MASSDDLWKAMKTAMELNGDMINLKMKLEESVLHIFQQIPVPQFMSESLQVLPTRTVKPAMPPEIILINSLIIQYMLHAGLQFSANVLSRECGFPENFSPNALLQSKFSSLRHHRCKPLLHLLVEEYKGRKQRHDQETYCDC